MNSFLQTYFSWGYLSGMATEPIWEQLMLIFASLALIVPIAVRIFLKIKKRSKAYRKLDRLWFWGYLVMGLVGLFLWFCVDQQLPLFGVRIVLAIWALSIFGYGVWLLIYARGAYRKKVEQYFEKKRKDKYLK